MSNPPDAPPEKKMTPTAKFARIFDLLSLRDPTLNATLYEDEEFGGLLRDTYANLAPKDPKQSADEPFSPTPEKQHFDKVWSESRARVAPLVREALESENITSDVMNFRMRSPDAPDTARRPVFPCLECDLGFETAYALESHNAHVHPLPIQSDSGELERALAEFEKRVIEWECIDPECDPSYEELAGEKYVAARKSVTDLFERLRAEQFVELTDPKTGNKLPAPAKVVVEVLSKEILALQQSALTRDEAEAILAALNAGVRVSAPITEKLRSLSSLRSSSLGEQKT